MSISVTIECDICQATISAGDREVDLVLSTYGWDVDPALGHRCLSCLRLPVTSSDDRLVILSTVRAEAELCRCNRLIFFGKLYHAGGRRIPFNVEPHHCGYMVESCVTTPTGVQIHMYSRYFNIKSQKPGPVYSNHRCRK